MKKLLTLTLSLLMAFSMCLTVSAGSGQPAFEVNNNKYITFNNVGECDGAICEVSDNAEKATTITLIRDYDKDYDSDSIVIPANKKVILDLNGYKLFAKVITVQSGAELTIEDKTASGNGYGYANGTVYFADVEEEVNHIDVYGKFTLTSGYINVSNSHSYANHNMIYAQAGSTVEISGGRISGSETPIGVATSGDGATISVTGGTFGKDVSGYLGEGCSIVYSNRSYVVYNQNTKPDATKTPVLASLTNEARSILNEKTIYGASEQDSLTVDSSTQVVLQATYEEEYKEGEEEKVKAVTIDNVSNLEYIPLDITLKAINSDGEKEIHDLGNDVKIPVTLYLNPEAARELNNNKVVKVIRVHDGDATLLEDSDVEISDDRSVLTIKTGKFSTYAIAYGTSTSSGSSSSTTTTPTKTYDPKDKNRDGIITCDEEMNSANWVWSNSKGTCVYSVTNTSVR